MPTLDRIFVVIDPTTDHQSALQSAAVIADRNKGSRLHAYCAIYNGADTKDPEALKRVETARHQVWLEDLVGPVRESGLQVDCEVEWARDWRGALGPAARRANADLVVKAASQHSATGRRFLKTSDWSLLRNAPCPVYLVKKERIDTGAKVLVAVDITRDEEVHRKLNEAVLEYGRAIVESIADAELHAVNAYSGSSHFVHPPDLAKATSLPRAAAHTVDGAPERVIPDCAEQIGASVVIVGTTGRAGLSGAILGNTAERILDAVQTNILTVPAASLG